MNSTDNSEPLPQQRRDSGPESFDHHILRRLAQLEHRVRELEGTDPPAREVMVRALTRIAEMLPPQGKEHGPFDAENAVTLARGALGLPLRWKPDPLPDSAQGEIAAPADPWSATGAIAKLAEHLEGRKGDDGLDMLTMRLGDARRIVNDHQALKRQLEEAQRNLEVVQRARLAEREAKEALTTRQHEKLAQREALLRAVVDDGMSAGLFARIRSALEQAT